ncbi:hypothetical protein Tco_0735214, partial [Tanacetum coccineum]
DGTNFESGVPDEQHLKTTGADEGTNSEEEDDDDGGSDDHDNDSDDERTESDSDEIHDPNLTNVVQTEHEEEDIDERVYTPSDYELTNDENINDEEMMDEEEEDEVTKELYKDVNMNLGNKDTEMTNADQADNEIALLMETCVRHATAVLEITSSVTTTIHPPPSFINPLPHQATPTPTPITFAATTSMPSLLDFSSVFRFNDRVTNMEKNLSEIKQVDQYAQALSSIPAIVDHYIKNKLGEAINKSTLKRSRDDREKDQDPSAGSGRWTKRKKSRKEAELSRDSREPSHTVDDSGVQQDQEFDTVNNDEQPADKEVTKDDWFKKPERPPTPNSYWYKRKHVDSRPSQTWISQIDRAKEPRTLFDELMDTSFDFSAFVLNWLNIKDLTQEILVGLAFELLKGTCKSLTELEYHLEECSKATTERHDKHNPEGKPYMFDLNKPLSLIQDHRFRQVIPQDFFINNDLEYLKGGDFSRR